MNVFLKIIIVLGIGVLFFVSAMGLVFISIILLRRLGYIPEVYKLIDYNRENIYLESRCKKRIITWREISSICSYSLSNCRKRIHGPIELILRNGETYTLGYMKVETNSLLERLYDLFSSNLKEEIEDINEIEFSHPLSWRLFKNNSFRRFRIWCLLTGLVWFLLLSVFFIYNEQVVSSFVLTSFFVLFIPILSLIMFFRSLRLDRKHKGVLSLKVTNDNLNILDEYDNLGSRKICDIRSFKLGKTQGALEFIDGTRILDLEKLSYWPILREYLLPKVELSEKTSD